MLSERGAEFIGRFEGFRAEAYNDAVNNATIGYGHLLHFGPVTAKDNAVWGTISRARGIQLLQADAANAAAGVARAIRIRIPLAQCQLDALISFAFNCGGGAVAGGVGAAVNAGADPTAALEQWDHAGGQVLQGLLTRRKAEARLYVLGDYGDGGKLEPPRPPMSVLQQRYLWAAWRLGEGEFRRYGKANATVRPKVLPARIPASWFAWYRGFLAARRTALKSS